MLRALLNTISIKTRSSWEKVAHLDFPQFNGDYFDSWITKVKNYFNFDGTSNEGGDITFGRACYPMALRVYEVKSRYYDKLGRIYCSITC